MNYKKRIFIVFFLLTQGFCIAQTYTGKNKLGKLEFLDDSICLLSFISTEGRVFISKCSFVQNKDTLFLTTRVHNPFEIKISEKKISVKSGFPTLIKRYVKSGNIYKLGIESCFAIYDTIQRKLIINDFYTKPDDLLVIQDGIFYVRLKVCQEMSFFSITFLNNDYNEVLFLNNFPLLMKGNKLVPCGNKDKLEECWVYNGFYFPIMKKSKKDAEFETIVRWSIGLRGLCNCFNIE